MKLVQRMLMGFGGVTLTAVIFSLVAPQASHALVATLVQVTNTAVNPAITQDVSKLASQNIAFLGTIGNNGMTSQLHVVGKDGVLGSSFTVPNGQTLMISSVDFFPNSASNFTPAIELSDSANLTSEFGIWWGPAGVSGTTAVSAQYLYPSGIAIQAGITPVLLVTQPTWSGQVVFQIHGYLTSN